ncbi:nucleotide-binding universal stress UspA family protein [Actinoplanes tereljensis]|uniref:Universal stress protein n=1 Tax=Paractinoplanes tereljensis TaxID=571912 RepID=A0A919NQQ5_9ACTN|nr:universal stress protein [Actinoplanes tereljensis]GIF23371.1 universal stress protein [Actinoplanes tereljensis]
MRVNPIIVGADGTDWSTAAVRWAAREAHRLHLPLRVTHVFDWEWREARYDMSQDYLDLPRCQAEAITAKAAYEARMIDRGLQIDDDLVVGNPAPRLLADSENSRLIVLGSRGRGGFGSLLLGSVSQRVATHAKCSVVVVRGRGDVTDGPVVAGVDDSPSADLVLETAFDAADRRGSTLRIVRSYLPPLPLWMASLQAVDVPTPVAEAEERARLEEQLAPWRDKFPDVSVELVLTHESVASALVNQSEQAQLVMVGSRGRGVIAGALLGSTGLQLLHHAECPVYIVRPSAEGPN